MELQIISQDSEDQDTGSRVWSKGMKGSSKSTVGKNGVPDAGENGKAKCAHLTDTLRIPERLARRPPSVGLSLEGETDIKSEATISWR